jgi:hypothetical protein
VIRLAEEIEYLETRKVPIDTKHKRIFVEVASNRLMDVAVVDADQLKAFDDSETGDDVDIDWTEYTRGHEFVYELPDHKRRFLLLWNANEEDTAVVAYKITPIE